MTVVSAFVETGTSPSDRHCGSCGRAFAIRTPLRQSDLDDLARVNGWHISTEATWCPGCRCARMSLSDVRARPGRTDQPA
ncbi:MULTISPECIES: hypothetical protein [unclassified Gordonia (in: high G+C Gram-positive bacteria)]|jgi:hypothetical protein|uniref:hypothetical protein n=1 Tax=Gordonia TaxID=2053 RepID=UPI00071DA9D1|nr:MULTISPECIES: hypothetical protein [unclassified Gordonia (in: high G+C Gram-positive bacteria)]OCW87657.1 hypothetical protein A8M60_15680 [Nocardia farcinica]KSU59610.1 hypothetical protein AS181_06250 [Gordonia sp. SGD-V-85]MCX2752867.1 hypothetical protein [Gordonia sp. 4N]MDT0220472.1 hypothetical protein [Gordonia sp. AC31]SCC01627.1 hypothetical protein GA0061091_104156 [Gordonia sp. v-85]